MTYDWQAALAFIATLIASSMLIRFIVFQFPEARRMRELNAEADAKKMARASYREGVEQSLKSVKWSNYPFAIGVLPFCVSFSPLPWWRHLVDIVMVLMIFDFMYYLVHRFLFHGKLLRKVHALHHQARTPTFMDSTYVHPIENLVGNGLFLISIPIVALIWGAPLNVFSAAFAMLVYMQLNTLNHIYVNLPNFPYKTVNWITSIHAAHNVDMNQGNFATLTMLYDWMFGTLEKPVSRDVA